MLRCLNDTYDQLYHVIEKAISNTEIAVKVVDQTPINLTDYCFSFFITLLGAFVGGWFAFRFNRIQEKKKQDYDDKVERIEKIYVPLCTAVEKLMEDAYGRDTGDYGEPSVFVLDTAVWKEYRKALRTLFCAQNRRLMLKDELEEIGAFYKQTEELNTQYGETLHALMMAYESGNADSYLSRDDAMRDIACYAAARFAGSYMASDKWYMEALAENAPVLNTQFIDYIQTVENIYGSYLSKIGVSDIGLGISLLEKTQP